jgi:hypothetical protein
MTDGISWVCYVPFADIEAYLALGWTCDERPKTLHPVLDAYRVIMTWAGAGEPRMPKDEGAE